VNRRPESLAHTSVGLGYDRAAAYTVKDCCGVPLE
jgi:hypothetical protein